MSRDPFRNVKWFVLGYFVLLILILTVIGIFGQLGYMFIDMSVACVLFGLLACSALVAGTVWLVRRFVSKAARILAGSLGVLLTFAAAVILALVSSLMLNFGVPAHFTTLVSEGGRAAVVVRQFGADEELRALRAGDPEAEDGVDFSRLGYAYSAYPRHLRFFYDTNRPAQGALEIGCSSQAQLMYEWIDGDKLHLYIEGAEPGDAGELYLNLND